MTRARKDKPVADMDDNELSLISGIATGYLTRVADALRHNHESCPGVNMTSTEVPVCTHCNLRRCAEVLLAQYNRIFNGLQPYLQRPEREMNKWFGPVPWCPACDDTPRAEIPVGQLCSHCEEPIAAGESGMMIMTIRERGVTGADPIGIAALEPVHEECNLRRIIGGVNHLKGTCSCCGGTADPDPPELTVREAARAAVKLYRENPA